MRKKQIRSTRTASRPGERTIDGIGITPARVRALHVVSPLVVEIDELGPLGGTRLFCARGRELFHVWWSGIGERACEVYAMIGKDVRCIGMCLEDGFVDVVTLLEKVRRPELISSRFGKGARHA